MLNIFRKEVSSFFNSLIAYIVIGVFLLLTGLMFWLYPDTNILDYGYAEMNTFFQVCPYLLMVFVPAVTMRMFSEEIKSGTLELLFTKPISVWNIILGKYFSCLFIIVLALLPTLIYYITVYNLGNPVGNIDSAAVFGSYFGLILLVSVYVAVGVFTSSITKNQVVAFLLAIISSYILFSGIEQFSNLFSGSFQYILSFVGLSFHYSSIGKGVVDSRDVVYFVTLTLVFLFLTLLSLNSFRK